MNYAKAIQNALCEQKENDLAEFVALLNLSGRGGKHWVLVTIHTGSESTQAIVGWEVGDGESKAGF